jgi:hypothetical protein
MEIFLHPAAILDTDGGCDWHDHHMCFHVQCVVAAAYPDTCCMVRAAEPIAAVGHIQYWTLLCVSGIKAFFVINYLLLLKLQRTLHLEHLLVHIALLDVQGPIHRLSPVFDWAFLAAG